MRRNQRTPILYALSSALWDNNDFYPERRTGRVLFVLFEISLKL